MRQGNFSHETLTVTTADDIPAWTEEISQSSTTRGRGAEN